MLILREAHLIYHYGDDRPWNSSEFKDYTQHNVSEVKTMLKKLVTNSVHRAKLAAFCEAHGDLPGWKPYRGLIFTFNLTYSPLFKRSKKFAGWLCRMRKLQ